jgi:integration host factor subunit beta
VTKSELIAILASRYPQLAARDTDYAVKTVLDAMTQALASGQRIEIRGFGSFSLSERLPRIGRNPKSGEKVMVPGKRRTSSPARNCANVWIPLLTRHSSRVRKTRFSRTGLIHISCTARRFSHLSPLAHSAREEQALLREGLFFGQTWPIPPYNYRIPD